MSTQCEKVTMYWYSWLSKTNLEQSLIYKYGLLFMHNELQEEDLIYFNHEFLQSIGIGLAKHRVEILNLARKELKEGTNRLNGFSWLILAMNKTKKLLTKNIGKLNIHKNSCRVQVSELPPYQNQQSKAIPELINAKANQQMVTSRRNVIRSGPIDTQMQDKYMLTSRSVSGSGPLDGKMHTRITYTNRSPIAATTQPKKSKPKENMGFISRSPNVVEPMDKRVQDKFMLNRRRVSVSGPIDCNGQGGVMYPNLSPINTNGWPNDKLGLYSRSPIVNKPKDNLGLYSRSPTVDRRGQEKLTKSRSVSVSGPLDGDQQRITYPNRIPMATTGWPMERRSKEDLLGFYSRSPSVSEPINNWGLSPKMNYYSVNLGDENIEPQSLWSMMFQDIKPT